MEEVCPDCRGEDISCPFGDWSWGEAELAGDDRQPTTALNAPT